MSKHQGFSNTSKFHPQKKIIRIVKKQTSSISLCFVFKIFCFIYSYFCSEIKEKC